MSLLDSLDPELVKKLNLGAVLKPTWEMDGRLMLISDGRNTMELLDLLQHPALADLPIETLVLNRGATAKTLPKIAAHPGLKRVRRLRLIEQRIGDEGFARLCRSLPWLQHLHVLSGGVTNTGLAALHACDLALRSLAILGGIVGAEGTRAIAASKSAQTLEEIRLDNCKLDDAAIIALADSGQLAALRSLALSRAKIRAEGYVAIATGPWHAMQALVLEYASVSEQNVAALFSGPLKESLELLSLENTRTNDACLERIADARPDRLQTLLLSQTWIKGAGMRSLAAAAPTLEHLRLSADPGNVGKPEGDAIVEALVRHCTRLRWLDLAMWVSDTGLETLAGSDLRALKKLVIRDRITDAGLLALVKSEVLRTLELLDIGAYDKGGAIGDEGVRALAGSPNASALHELRLQYHQVGDAGLTAIAQNLALEILDLSGCKVESSGIEALCKGAHAAKLRELDLSFNAIGDAGAALLAQCSALSGLVSLRVSGCKLTNDGIEQLRASEALRGTSIATSYNP